MTAILKWCPLIVEPVMVGDGIEHDTAAGTRWVPLFHRRIAITGDIAAVVEEAW